VSTHSLLKARNGLHRNSGRSNSLRYECPSRQNSLLGRRRKSVWQAVKERADAYFARTGKSRGADALLWVKVIFYAGIAEAAYVMTLWGGFDVAGTLVCAILFGIASILLAINVGHEAAHNALAPWPWANRVLHAYAFSVIGVDPYLWRLRHTRSHHVFPNVNECDIDIDSNAFVRLSPNHPRRLYQRYQHIYALFLYLLVGAHAALVQDFDYLFKRDLANMRNIKHSPQQYALFFVRKAFYVSLVFVVPMMVLPFPWWQVLIGYFIMSAVGSLIFIAFLIGTHFADTTEFPQVSADGRLPHNFATHALVTSLDWHPTSRVAQWVAGGANAHVAHHLFPHVSHAHYVPLTRIIQDAAKEFGMPYRQSTFIGMICAHFRFLKQKGEG
jgi:linoleoyl-CoA desaturase